MLKSFIPFSSKTLGLRDARTLKATLNASSQNLWKTTEISSEVEKLKLIAKCSHQKRTNQLI